MSALVLFACLEGGAVTALVYSVRYLMQDHKKWKRMGWVDANVCFECGSIAEILLDQKGFYCKKCYEKVQLPDYQTQLLGDGVL
jgi:hypothetical protein